MTPRSARFAARSAAGAFALSLASALMLLAPACSEEDIVLATLPTTRTDSGMPMPPTRCVDQTECRAEQFCSFMQCGDVTGICEERPDVCSDDSTPVCGCDGITYWNDCLRRAAGIQAATPDECIHDGNARKCDQASGSGEPSDHCPPDTFCARLLPPPPQGEPFSCPPEVFGKCWALPVVCPEQGGSDRWLSCGPPFVGCVATCEAIRTGEPHRRATECP
jgi:hypothetical protein